MSNLSYVFEIDDKTAGLDAAIQKLGAAEKEIEKTGSGIKATEKSVGTLGGKYRELGSAIEGGAEKAKKSHHEHEEGFKGVGKSIDEAKLQSLEFFEFVGAIAAFEVLEKIADKFIEIGSEALHTAAAAERMDLSLKLTAGAEGAEEVLRWIDKIASKTEFTKDQLKGWSTQFLNAGVKTQEIDKFMAAALDISAKGGKDIMPEAVSALARASLRGQVSGRDLLRLNLPTESLATLPGFKGLNPKQVREHLEKTTLTASQLFKVIAGADGLLGDLGIQAGDTMEARLKNLRTLPEQFFEKFAESPAFDELKTKLDELFVDLDPNGPRGAAIFKSLEKMFSTLAHAFIEIDFATWANVLEKDVLPALAAVAKLALLVARTINLISGAGNAIADNVKFVFGDSKKNYMSLFRDWQATTAAVRQTGGIPNSADLAADLTKGFSGGLDKGAGQVAGAADRLMKTAIDASKDATETHSPSRVFMRLGEMSGEGYALGMSSSADDVRSATENAVYIPPPLSGSPATGAMSLSIGNITVHLKGDSGDPQSTGSAVAGAIMESVRAEMITFLEQLRAQQGS